jgi:hypothetical protein
MTPNPTTRSEQLAQALLEVREAWAQFRLGLPDGEYQGLGRLTEAITNALALPPEPPVIGTLIGRMPTAQELGSDEESSANDPIPERDPIILAADRGCAIDGKTPSSDRTYCGEHNCLRTFCEHRHTEEMHKGKTLGDLTQEFAAAIRYLQEHGYSDWDGTVGGKQITLTGCANVMRQYLQDSQPVAPAEPPAEGTGGPLHGIWTIVDPPPAPPPALREAKLTRPQFDSAMDGYDIGNTTKQTVLERLNAALRGAQK